MNYTSALIYISFLLFLGTSLCFSQQSITFSHISSNDGLSNNSVRCILQDQSGYMWFGTGNGLSRYDGYGFETFHHDPRDSNTLTHNAVNSLFEDSSGYIWVGTHNGLNRVSQTDLSVTRCSGQYHVFDAYRDKSGVFWIGTASGLHVLDDSLNIFKHPQNLAGSHNVHLLLETSPGILWAATHGGLIRIARVDSSMYHTIVYRKNAHDPNSISDNSISSLHYDDDGNVLWIGTYAGGLNCMNLSTGSNRSYRFDPNDPLTISSDIIQCIIGHDHNSNIWVGTYNGLNVYQGNQDNFVRYNTNSSQPGSISHNSVLTLYRDQFGIMWAGTQGGGLNKFDPTNTIQFFNIQHTPETVSSLPPNAIWSLLRTKSNELWIGSGVGLTKMIDNQYEGPKFSHYTLSPPIPRNAHDHQVRSIVQADDQVLWIGTLQSGLIKLNTKTFEWNQYSNDPDDETTISGNLVYSVYLDQSGTLWCGSNGGGLSKLITQSQTFRNYYSKTIQTDVLIDWIICIEEGAENELWLGAWTGLFRFLPASEEFDYFPFDTLRNSESSVHVPVYSLHTFQDQEIWVGTSGRGLCRLSWDSRYRYEYEWFTKTQGLPDNDIYAIESDTLGRIWVATEHGLAKLDPTTGLVKVFTIDDGLATNQFRIGASYSSDNNELIFGGDGIVRFSPGTEVNQVPPRTAIVGVKVFDEQIPNDFESATDYLELEYDQNFLTIEYVGLHYKNPQQIKYAYRMEGIDRQWNFVEHLRQARYTNLSSGEYKFAVKSANPDGVWSTRLASISLKIHPAPWNTWWAYILYFVVVVGAAISVWRYERNRLNLKSQLEKKGLEAKHLQDIGKLKARFFADISHEFRNPLSLIISPLENLVKTTKDVEIQKHLKTIYGASKRLLHRTDELRSLALIESNALKAQFSFFDVRDLLVDIVSAFKPFANQKEIQLKFSVNIESCVIYSDLDKLVTVFTNILSNAVKFTDSGGFVEIVLKLAAGLSSQEGDYIEIRIRDTGIGIPFAEQTHIFDRFYQVESAVDSSYRQGSGIGLALTREIVLLLKGTILLESEEEVGTTVTVRLPISTMSERTESDLRRGRSGNLVQQKVEAIFYDTHLPGKGKSGISSILLPASGKKPLILVVEDNQKMRAYMREVLRQKYRVAEAKNGEQGLDIAMEKIPDLIVCDIRMPVMDGFEFSEGIRSNAATSHIPIIMLTGSPPEEGKLRSLELGAIAYITKPPILEELFLSIRNQFDLIQRQQSHNRQIFDLNIDPNQLVSSDKQFIGVVKDVIQTNFSNADFNVIALAKMVGLGPSQLRRKWGALMDESPVQSIRNVRLEVAAKHLAKNTGNIAEIAHSVGIEDNNYFSKCFKERFNVTPSDFRREHQRKGSQELDSED